MDYKSTEDKTQVTLKEVLVLCATVEIPLSFPSAWTNPRVSGLGVVAGSLLDRDWRWDGNRFRLDRRRVGPLADLCSSVTSALS